MSDSSDYRGSPLRKSFLDTTAWCVSIRGEDLRTFCCENFYAYAWKSLVLCYTHGNELYQIHLITGAFHGVNPSLIICLIIMCLYMGRI